jgi:hypothetical protein
MSSAPVVAELSLKVDFPTPVFIELLRFIYTGRCNFDEDNLITLFEVADLYNLGPMRRLAECEMSKVVNEENVLDLLALAVFYDAQEVRLIKPFYINSLLIPTRKNLVQLRRTLIGFALKTRIEIPPEHLHLLENSKEENKLKSTKTINMR